MRATTCSRGAWRWLLVAAASLAVATPATATPPDDDDDDDGKRFQFDAADVSGAFRAPMPSPVAEMMMGATPGGAQDIAFARERILAGEVPHGNTFTPEGLFSEHDLPLDTGRACNQMICLTAAATPVDLIALPDARTLVQLGFSSNLSAATWQRDPMNLVAVIDKSGSMSGGPLETVKASLRKLADQLGPADQLSVVLYGSTTHVHLPPTPMADKRAVFAAIDAIASEGSTAMEAGLALGFDVARKTAPRFRGRTRVMLFTDERPNVGATHKGSFMAMAREASATGVGLTTIGVGTHFGAELATAISSVRGGNLFFFPDVVSMTEKFTDDLDTMLTELAYDLRLTLQPRKGYAIVGLFGIPGDLVQRTPSGGLEMTIETLFLSKNKGAIYLALGPEGAGALPPMAGPVGEAEVAYQGIDGKPYRDALGFEPWPSLNLPLGLARGRLLVDEVTTLKEAAGLHLAKNDQEAAWRMVRALKTRFEQSGVPGLSKELETIAALDKTLTRLSGHQGEPGAYTAVRDDTTGMPR